MDYKYSYSLKKSSIKFYAMYAYITLPAYVFGPVNLLHWSKDGNAAVSSTWTISLINIIDTLHITCKL